MTNGSNYTASVDPAYTGDYNDLAQAVKISMAGYKGKVEVIPYPASNNLLIKFPVHAKRETVLTNLKRYSLHCIRDVKWCLEFTPEEQRILDRVVQDCAAFPPLEDPEIKNEDVQM